MSASTEAILIEIVFGLGALIVIGGLVSLIVMKRHRQSMRPAMTIVLCGAGLVIIAILLNVLVFKTYDHVRVKKNQYYEATSLTTNMRASLASSRTANQPVSTQSKKASKNVTYLIKHLHQSKPAVKRAQAAQRELTTQKQPDLKLVRNNYRLILNGYFAGIIRQPATAQRVSQHAYHQVTTYRLTK
ncbi:hypothetical protein [Levilactobacillus enshiensis]|uniref:hypothetical protein n=1 Tax=Levilactobacillus enshiensis TaxID=2590213 RepID=UPI00117B6197|nr:hypothetical protein [Levilactobacillus enshiensis]